MADTPELPDLARLDIHRKKRAGIPEAVLAEGKTFEQVLAIGTKLAEASGRTLITRLPSGWGGRLADALDNQALEISLYGNERTAVVNRPDAQRPRSGGVIGLLAAGTSDIPVAEEARITAEEMGCRVLYYYDVGVAGIHRLVDPVKDLQQADVAAVVVAAGMEGALPTVTKGLLPVPVIGVPTSVGYGYGGGGEAALMCMLQSCSPGLTVVNIDNGFGAGATAALIANRQAAMKTIAEGSES